MINSVGVTSGTISLLYPVVIMVFLLLVAWYQKCCGRTWPKGYHQNDKDQVIDNLATLLLLFRDHKLTDSSGKHHVKQLQITRLAKELHVLSNQLVKQYQTPDQNTRKIRNCWYRLYSKLKTQRSRQYSEEKSDEAVGVVDVESGATAEKLVEVHYGRYHLVAPNAMSMHSMHNLDTAV